MKGKYKDRQALNFILNLFQQYLFHIPRIGPMIGDTSIAATIKTVALVAKPPAAIIDAPIKFNQVLIVIFALFEISANNSSVVLLAFN